MAASVAVSVEPACAWAESVFAGWAYASEAWATTEAAVFVESAYGWAESACAWRSVSSVASGMKRSTLVSEELDQAQQGNILSRTTLSLFYATDFADQLENVILPALRAGFIVLADRYIYTLMARDLVRGFDEAWLKNLYGVALEPDAVLDRKSTRLNSSHG